MTMHVDQSDKLDIDIDKNRVVAGFKEQLAHESAADISGAELYGDVKVFAPGAHGIYVVDLFQENWIGRPSLAFDLTSEIVVSRDHTTALVLFQSLNGGGSPGIAEVALQSGTLMGVIR